MKMKLAWFNKRKLGLATVVVLAISGSAWRLVNRAKTNSFNLETVRRGDLTLEALEADAGNLKVGQAARITVVSNPGVKFDAIVERIDTPARQPDKDSPVKYFEAVLKVEGRGGEILKPGKLVRTEITTASYEEALVVPRVAVVEEALKHYVWILRSGATVARPVEIGSGDTARVVIRSGVNEGEAVLLNPPKQSDAAKAKDKSSADAPARIGK